MGNLLPAGIGLFLVSAVIVVLLLVPFIMLVGIYNSLVRYNAALKNAFGQIDVQLRRRHDLIPNLVEVAKGYMAHERQTLEAVIAARGRAVSGLAAANARPSDGAAIAELSAAESTLTGAVGRLMVVAEAYPDLKANTNMMQLSEELTTTENRIAFARQAFNDAVTRFNEYRRTFPAVLFAGLLGHGSDAKMWELAAAERTAAESAPSVKF